MIRQLVFHPMFDASKSGQFTNPDGSRWDYMSPDNPEYDDQFREGFVSGNYVLLHWPIAALGRDSWAVAQFTGEHVQGSLGRLPVCYQTSGFGAWSQISREFAQLTGEHIPDDWRKL